MAPRWRAPWLRRLRSVLAGAASVAALLASGTASAQAPAYFVTNCASAGCHSDPAKISSTTDVRPFQIIDVMGGAAWLIDDGSFKAHLNALRGNAPAMATLADEVPSANRDIVRAYFIRLRDGAISNTTRSFGSTNVGATSTLTDTLTNDRFLGASFSIVKGGSNPADFTISGCSLTGGGLNGSVPAAGSGSTGSCVLSIAFTPQPGAATSRSASFTVSYTGNEGGDPIDRGVTLSGSVPAAALGVVNGTTATTARFDLGQSSDSNIATLTNTGQATLSITSIALLPPAPAGASYAQNVSPAGACASTPVLTAGQSCGLYVRYTPSVAGATTATFRITPSVGGVRDVSLQGTGVQPVINPTAQSLPFGNVQLGVPKTLPLVVSNTGTAPMTFSVAPSAAGARSGANPGDFAVGGTCQQAAPVAAGSNCTLSITFTPGGLNSRTATLTISSDASNGPLVVSLDGTGVALPEPVLTAPATDFPDTVIGETAAQTRLITLRNDRSRDISYAVVDLGEFKLGSESCAGRIVTGGGGTCTVAVQFKPLIGVGEGRRQATFTFTFAGTGGDIAPSNAPVVVAGVALLPLAQSAATLNAAAVVGSPTTSSLLLTNRSVAAITLTSLALGGAVPADYALDASNGCTPALVLGPSTSCTLVVRFAPAAAGTRNATLTVVHSAPGSPQGLTLLGTATPAPQGRIELGALALTYADTQLGASSAQTVILRNGGNLALTITAFTFAGANPADYTRSGDCNAAVPLAIGAQCNLTVTFRPSVLGARTATLAIASDASNGIAVLTLAGNGVPVPTPQVSLAPALLDFGTQTVAGIYAPRRVHLVNSGTADLVIVAVAVEGAGFASAGPSNCPAVLAAGVGCDVDIVFVAGAVATSTGNLRLTSNAAGSPHTVALKGVGTVAAVPVLVWSPATTRLDFGAVSAGKLSPIQSLMLVNQGPGGANLSVLNAIGADAASFSVVGGTCAVGTPLFEGQSCRVDLRFAPGFAGTKSATVQVASTGSFPPTLSLVGIGLAGPNPSLQLSATAIAFASTRVGAQSLPTTLRLASAGSGVVTVTALAVSGAWNLQGSTCPAVPFTLPAGTDCTVSIAFAPTTSGAAAGTVHVGTDAAPVARDVALSGSGEAPADVSGGGCTVVGLDADPAVDPLFWLLVLAAVVVLLGRAAPPKRGRL